MHRYKTWLGAAALLVVAAPFAFAPRAAKAANFAMFSDNLTYTGTVTKYGTLTDAQNQTNPISTTAVPLFTYNGTNYNRNLSVYINKGAPLTVETQDYNEILTAWWYNSSLGNPNNSSTGFFQMHDDGPAYTWITSSAQWDSTFHTYTFSEKGKNATYAKAFSRLWNAPVLGGSAADTRGQFINYSLNLTANFADAATQQYPNWYSITEEPTSLTGHLTGIFQNQCSLNLGSSGTCSDSSNDGFYTFDFLLTSGSWVLSNVTDVNNTGPYSYSTSYFAAATPIPSSLLLMLSGLAFVAYAGRKRLSRDTAA